VAGLLRVRIGVEFVMRDVDLFQVALGLLPPWLVKSAAFEVKSGDVKDGRLDLTIDFTRGGRFACAGCGKADCPVHDTETKTWRHLDFFQHKAYLTARTPRTDCSECGVKLVNVPWARPNSGFTLLFEASVMTLVAAMPVRAAAELVREHDTRLWRIVIHYVEQAVARLDLADLRRVAIDETAAKRGHAYISVFIDIDRRRVVYVTEGRDASTVKHFADHVDGHNSDASRIKQVCIDMSGAFIKGVSENLTEANITFDKFHVIKQVNEGVDEVRRQEVKTRTELKGSRYLWLKNEANLSARGRDDLASLASTNLKTARAYRMRLAFQQIYAQPSRAWAELFLDRWLSWVKRSRLEPMTAVARTIVRHRDGILAWFDSRIANGIAEGINSIIQATKAKARGYRTIRNLTAMTYLVAGKLDLSLPT
jgi:transposase